MRDSTPLFCAPYSRRNSVFSSSSISRKSCSIPASTTTYSEPVVSKKLSSSCQRSSLCSSRLNESCFLLQTYRNGLAVSKCSPLRSFFSSSVASSEFASCPASRCGSSRSNTAFSAAASLFPVRTSRSSVPRRLLTASPSAMMSSRLMTSISPSGSTLPVTWWMSPSSKIRTTSAIMSVSRMLERNLLPRPSPAEAPLTRPAISTNSTTAGIIFCDPEMAESVRSRPSGTATTPTEGSIVAKG